MTNWPQRWPTSTTSMGWCDMTAQLKIDLLMWALIVFAFNQILFAGIAIELVTTQTEGETPMTVFVVTAILTLVFTSTCVGVGAAIACYVKRIQQDSGT